MLSFLMGTAFRGGAGISDAIIVFDIGCCFDFVGYIESGCSVDLVDLVDLADLVEAVVGDTVGVVDSERS